MASPRPANCTAGDEALARGAWSDARDAFESALRARESAEALEGLGTAAWWLDLADEVFDARERAYRLYLVNLRMNAKAGRRRYAKACSALSLFG